jgi:hypothetical protein
MNKNIPLTTFLILSIFSALEISAQPIILNWDKTYGGNSRDWNTQIINNGNGHVFMIGDSQTDVDGDKTTPLCNIQPDHSDIWLIKSDVDGNIIWQRNYGAENNETAPKLLLLSNAAGEMIFTCYSNSDIACDKTGDNRDTVPLLSSDYWIVKLDSNGVIIWEKTIGGENFDELNKIAVLSNGNLVIAGESISPVGYDKSVPNYSISKDIWVVILDPNGNKISDHIFGGDGGEFISSILPDNNGGYLITGSTNSGISGDVSQTSQGNFDFWMIKVDNQGNKVWDKRFGGAAPDICNHASVTNDGGYILAGYTVSPQGGDVSQTPRGLQDYWVVRTNSSGIKVWDKRFGGSGGSFGTHVAADVQGAFWLTGYTNSTATNDVSENSYGGTDYWHVKLDAGGNKLLDKRFGGSGNDFGTGISILNDTTFMAFGYSDTGSSAVKTAISKGWFDYWVVKFTEPDTTSGIFENAYSLTDFSISPNPANQVFQLQFNSNQNDESEITVADISGRILMKQNIMIVSGINKISTDISMIAQGVYIVNLSNNSHKLSTVLIKQ